MLKNYIKIAMRVLSRHKVYVALNVVGLGFALACCLLAYLNYEYRASFDLNYTGTENIYRLNSIKDINGSVQKSGVLPLAMGEALKKNHAGIEKSARLFNSIGVIKNKESVFNEQVYYADAALFDFFNFAFVEGNPSQFINRNTVIISDAFAKKIFQNGSALNQKLGLIDKAGIEQIFTVTGVMKKAPQNSSFQFDIITLFDNYYTPAEQIDWRNNSQITTFLKISNKSFINTIEKQLQGYTSVYNSSRDDHKIKGFALQPFKDIAFSSDKDLEGYVYDSTLNSNPRGVIVIGPAIMSFLILLIACFNFTNISISFATNRLKEIGIRKVLGGVKRQLVEQFLTENLILCTLSSLIAIALVASILPSFNSISSLSLKFNLSDSSLYLFLLALPLFTAFISGLYPAFYISSFKPISILKGQTTFGSSNNFTRFLLVAQFTLSCLALIVGISLDKNSSYQETVDYGYAINELAVLNVNNQSEYNTLSDAIKKNPRITSVAGTVHQIGEGSPTLKVQVESNATDANVATIGGEEYLKAVGVTLMEGRHFYNGNSLDQDASVLVNQTLLSTLNIKSPLGQKIKVDSAYYTIVGVVNDYKESGLHGKVPPIVLKSASTEDFNYLVLRTNKNSLLNVYKSVQDTWHQVLPAKPFAGFLQNELIEKEVYMNAGFKSVAFFLAISTIVLSASGIFALVSLNIIRRKKEIGVRKVLGASILSIIGLINKDFIRIVILSFILGSGLGYLLVDNLLFKFIYEYHPEMGVMPFVLTLIIILLTSAITVGAKVYRASISNPINSLRDE